MDQLEFLSPEAARALDRALLEADPETLTDTQRSRRDRLESGAGGSRTALRGPPRRPSTAAAAERALAGLPAALAAAIATDRRLRESEVALLALLCRRARRRAAASCAPSVPELARRLGCAERTVQFAARALARHGLIAVQQRVLRPGHNATNVYTVVCPRLAGLLKRSPVPDRRPEPGAGGRGESAPPRGESPSAPRVSKISTPLSHRVTPKDPATCEPVRQASPPRTAGPPPAAAPPLPETGPLAELARRALDHVAPDLAAATRGRPDPWQAWQRLFEEKLADFQPRLWRRALALHGPRAWLAVAETLLKDQAGQIRCRESYLWGIVKHGMAAGTARRDCDPEISVAEILDERAAGPEATKAALSIALSEALARRPREEQVAYWREASPAERRRAGRLARRGRAEAFRAEIVRVAKRCGGPAGEGGGLGRRCYEAVREIAPGTDIGALEEAWRGWCARQGLIPARPDAHFLAFARKWAARRAGEPA